MPERRTPIAVLCLALAAVCLAAVVAPPAEAAIRKEMDVKMTAKQRAKFQADHLWNLVEQAMDWNLSDEMIEEIMGLFKVRYKGKVTMPLGVGQMIDLRDLASQREKFLREMQRQFQEQGADRDKFIPGPSSMKPGDKPGEGEPGFEGAGEAKGTPGDVKPLVPTGPGGDGTDWTSGGPLDEQLKKMEHLSPELKRSLMQLQQQSTTIPLAEARRLEGLINNAIMDALKGRDFQIAALGVYLHSSNEVKVILIVATSNMERSRIRGTLTDVRGVIENEVLKPKFPQFKLAQLSSFTILNEVENHFYEHAVLYWQMQLPGWQVPTKEIPISRPVQVEKSASRDLPKEGPGTVETPRPADMEFDEADFLEEGAL